VGSRLDRKVDLFRQHSLSPIECQKFLAPKDETAGDMDDVEGAAAK